MHERAGELAEHWVEKKAARKELREKAALMRRQLAESAVLFDFEKGLHFNANGARALLLIKRHILNQMQMKKKRGYFGGYHHWLMM